MKLKNVIPLNINPDVALRHLETFDENLDEDFGAGLIGFGALVTEIKQVFVQLSYLRGENPGIHAGAETSLTNS